MTVAHLQARVFTDWRGWGAEDKATALAACRLRDRFPDVESATVEGVVSDFHRDYDGRPIREFVAVLLDREAREHLPQMPIQWGAPH